MTSLSGEAFEIHEELEELLEVHRDLIEHKNKFELEWKIQNPSSKYAGIQAGKTLWDLDCAAATLKFLVKLVKKQEKVLPKAFKTDILKRLEKFNPNPELELLRLTGLSKDKSKHSKEGGFSTTAEFVEWWVSALEQQEGKCHYCDAKFTDIQRLISAKLLGTRKLKMGAIRGPNPEVERLLSLAPHNIYSAKNCVLACYYCNNDKSNVYGTEDYKRFIAPAKGAYISHLLTKLKS